MSTAQPPYQLELPVPERGEAPHRTAREAEVIRAMPGPESPAVSDRLMEEICAPDNMEAAVRAVVRNKGAAGIDGITVKQLPAVLAACWPEIEGQLLQGRYQPQPGWKSPSRPAGRATSAFPARLTA